MNINNQNEFELLRKIDSKKFENSQRILAKEMGMSLGKLNYCIKALKVKGLIKIKNFKNNKNKMLYAYLLTPKGITYKTKMVYYFMKQKLNEYEELKREIENKKNI